MKSLRLFFLFTAIACMTMAGCEKKNSPPAFGPIDSCGPCEEYAPDSLSVSWTDYNGPARLRSYFGCHSATLAEHLYDTLLLSGWVYFYNPGEGPDFGDWTIDKGWTLLVDDDNHRGYEQSIMVTWEECPDYTTAEDSLWLAFKNHFDEYLEKKWYVEALVLEKMMYVECKCCRHDPRFKIIHIDTISLKK